MESQSELKERRAAPRATRTDLTKDATRDITGTLNAILADIASLN